MPVCPECSFWTPEFVLGDVDHNGTYVAFHYLDLLFRWYCNGCWQAWEDERREKRLTSGKLLPEDRSLWYTSTTRPVELLDYDRDEPHVQFNQQYQYDRDWFKVNTYSLVIEGVCVDSNSSSTPNENLWITSESDDLLRVTVPCKATQYRSLKPRINNDEEFVFDFNFSYLRISNESKPDTIRPKSLADISATVPFPNRILGDMYLRFRDVAREARRFHFLQEEEALKKEIEQQQLRKKQQVEIQQKQKDLVQLALKRAAQNKKPAIVSTPPSNPVPSPPNTAWTGPQPVIPQMMVMVPPVADPWSANNLRPMIPPPMQWAPMMQHPMHHFIQQPVDPWSSAAAASATPVRNPWASTDTLEAKRAKVEERSEPADKTDKQRMARLGVPFK